MHSDSSWLEHVRPPNWQMPAGGSYDLVVIGGGTAGLVSAVGAAGLGARVALVERARLGGDCLNVGCVPSKALLRSARALRDVRTAAAFGVAAGPATVDFAAVMRRVRDVRARLAPNDSAQRLASLGVDVYFGAAQFTGPRTVTVEDRTLRFRRAVIATGGRPAIPGIPGLAERPYLTNETVFDLDELPKQLLVIGAGPVGCELAQAFALLGADVTLTDIADRPLPREDPDASAILERRLRADGVHVALGLPPSQIAELLPPSQKTAGAAETWDGGSVLVAAGRTPNIEGLKLDAAGVQSTAEGVVVNDRLQTTNPRVYAAGDVAAPWKFTHAADATARMVLWNAFFLARRRTTDLIVPWCTYTMPEVAHVGLSAADAKARGCQTITVPFAELDRAVLDGEEDGFLRIHHDRGRLFACTAVGSHSGDLIAHVANMMRLQRPFRDFADTIVPYPTYSDALRKAADAFQRTRLTPPARQLLRKYFSIARRF